jgi:hypothetical protein
LHLVLPSLAVDAITLALLVIAVLPWVAPLVKSVELPGGLKLELRDLERATARADTAGLLAAEPSSVEQEFSFEAVAARDPNLALAGLRIEIERRLTLLARAHRLQLGRLRGVGQLLQTLTSASVLRSDEQSVLADMIGLLNAAVHGADVDQRAAEWALDVGPRLLTALDQRIAAAAATKQASEAD